VIQNDGAKTSRLALTFPCHPLLDYTSAKIGVNLTLPGSFNGFKQGFVRDTLLTSEALEPRILEYPHKAILSLTPRIITHSIMKTASSQPLLCLELTD
jgi:hypothetical protein